MVDSAMANLISQLKPLVASWGTSDQVQCVDLCIATWAANNWGTAELITCETELTASFTAEDASDESIE